MSSAIHELISAVRIFNEAEFTDSEPDNMVTNIMEVITTYVVSKHMQYGLFTHCCEGSP